MLLALAIFMPAVAAEEETQQEVLWDAHLVKDWNNFNWKSIIHCIAADTEDMVLAYKTIRHELKEYSAELYEKPEYVLITKTDLITADELKTKIKLLEKGLVKLKKVEPVEVLNVSIIDDASVKILSDFFVQTLQKTLQK